MDDKIYLRDLSEINFTKDEFIEYYNRCIFFGISICEDATFKIGKFKNISCGIYNVNDEYIKIPSFVDEIYCNKPYFSNLRIKHIDFNNVKTICRDGLSHFYKLESINAPNVKTIGGHAFYGCSNLELVDFPKLKYLGKYCFSGCTSLSRFTSLTLKEIKNYSFIHSNINFIYAPKVSLISDFGTRRTRLVLNNNDDDTKYVYLDCADNLEIRNSSNIDFKGNYELVELINLDEGRIRYFATSYNLITKYKKCEKENIFRQELK